MMKRCLEQHALLHTLVGVGLGLLLAGLVVDLANPLIGLILVVVGLAADYMLTPKRARA